MATCLTSKTIILPTKCSRSMKIILFDIIGQKSGCKYYDTAFYKQLLVHGYDAEVHSNFSVNQKTPTIENIYTGNKIQKIFHLLRLLPSFVLDVLRNRNNIYVYMTYGEAVDGLLIFLLLIFHPKPTLDVHEFISLDKEGNSFYSKFFSLLYRKIYTVIYHSERSEYYLDSIHYTGRRLFVPHFKYEFTKDYNIDKIDESVRSAVAANKINILFFGHMRKSKGINLVFDSIEESDVSVLKHLHFIFAGDDSQSIVKRNIGSIDSKISCSTILRFIDDSELNYLFDAVDLVLLPYEEVSQSGILETAVYFRKVMVLTDIAYFKTFSSSYPSFSYMIEKNNPKMLAMTYREIVESGIKHYSQQDVNRFYETDKFDLFFQQLRTL